MMKIRLDFVTNSSSSSFIITNKTNSDLTLVDFVLENPQLIEQFKHEYDWYKDNPSYCQERLLKSAEEEQINMPAGSSEEYIFGDEDGTLIGHVFDYILRSGGSSESFSWEYHNSYR